ncbi:type II toxin-antitoxin system PemK/MazF family toxin [Aquisalimonas lutea]|uniref:type II toxin-antitoxin system PemK/MazF family toxin n=1 Tax=Aquisalimonas lutea TaxID=1327750 RepID=UPI0025B50784|nr:type II toxin-antitoxin system PemK/MazF family toxin [Aquisalimonas lutea]MDN3517233.1 type II toxin-antitoxin system PemK/MazF family toxin [Aquisalimonas lutea]
MKRGDLVTVGVSGDYGKPRPAVVVQSDFFDEHPSATVLPVTRYFGDTPLFRIEVAIDSDSNLRTPSQVMVDKAVTVSREKIGAVFGSLSAEAMLAVDRSLALFLGIAN